MYNGVQTYLDGFMSHFHHCDGQSYGQKVLVKQTQQLENGK